MKVCLDTINKVKDFVRITSDMDGDVMIKSGRYLIDAKSIMGVFSLNLMEPLELEFDGCKEEDIEEYLKRIEEFVA